ncbi:ubiquitin-like domain-containing protein [Neobacillus sp. PS3-40]|uniref:ubiquitin-like domain-containing protein n=1 Tax=Neobacillus sp. PS3-40 TaxID=3070679 RepID=UPI0027E06060|nr:ubiquitin-like domain-containing protein [Neobacillus sp. PS3-40]WML42510.1 ubiquitin-like domain-containing protein [Neobacillus sp. PS3-40]
MKNLFSKSLRNKKWTIIFASFVVFAATLGILFNEGSKKSVALTLNGQTKIIKTHANTVQDLLNELHVVTRSQDYLFPKKGSKLQENLKITWKQARQVRIVKDNEKKTVWTTANTVGDLLKEQKVVLNEHDQISPGSQDAIKDKMKIEIKVANHLTLVDGGKQQHQVWSTSTTVADFLTQQGIKLKQLDRVEPSLSEKIRENGVINVIRVEKVTDVVEEPILFAVVTRKDSSLAKGKEKIVSKGQQGLASRKFEVILENGKEVSRKLISENKVKEKQDKVVAVGTKELAQQVSRGEGSNGEEYYVNTTAYTADCNGCSGNTATGINLHANPNSKVIAVDPRIIPLGTKVYVDGYGYAVAADTGSNIKGFRIDVFFSSKAEAYRWGTRKVKIKVLN